MDKAREINEDRALAPATRHRRVSSTVSTLSVKQMLSIGSAIGASVLWAWSLSASIQQTENRLTSLELATKQVRVMVLQNRVLTLEIAKELAAKVDTATDNARPGLSGVDLAIQQARAELDRAKEG